MLAILSDIHGNLEALQAVLADIKDRSIGRIYCLGDIVGYGPDPSACVEVAENFDLCLAGNWEIFVSDSIRERRSQIERLQEQYEWTRSQLTANQIQFLGSLRSCERQESLTFAHGSPLDYVNDYLFPEQVYDREHMHRVFQAFDGVFVCGHTHIPGIFTESEYHEPQTIDFRFNPDGKSSIINVGSVGQPRDNDARACYVAYDGDSFEFIRVDYDIGTTRRKINDLGRPPLGSDT